MRYTRPLSVLLALTLTLLAAAQPRIAVFNSQAIFNAMPEKQAAESRLQATSARLQAEYNQMQTQLDQDYADYQALAADGATPATILERRLQQVQEGDKRLQSFQADAADEIARQRNTLMTPILSAIEAAVTEVGDEEGYDLIIDTAKTPVAYRNSATVTDVTPQIRAKLGIKQ